MLSDDIGGSSATVRCTRRRAYGLSGPISCGGRTCFAFSIMNRAICLQLGVLALAVVHAVDDEAAVVVELAAEARC